jgi:hypothetical protein
MRFFPVAVVILGAALLLDCHPGVKSEWQPTEKGFVDTDTGLSWLALRETRDRTYTEVSEDAKLAAAGWRIATLDEVRHLLNRWLPGVEGQQGEGAEGHGRAVDLLARMGYHHFNPASGNNNVYGMLAADNGSPPVVTIWYRAEKGDTRYGWFADRYGHVDRLYRDFTVGVFMVRDAAARP